MFRTVLHGGTIDVLETCFNIDRRKAYVHTPQLLVDLQKHFELRVKNSRH